MNNEFTLRLGSQNDFDQLYLIYMHEKVNRYLNFEVINKENFINIFNELCQTGELYVYEYQNNIVATCIVVRQKRRVQHAATISTLATHPDFHGKGIGTKFMVQIINTLKDSGIKRIDLYAEADNPVAISFYRKLGFELEGVLKKYFKRANENQYIDEYVMALIP